MTSPANDGTTDNSTEEEDELSMLAEKLDATVMPTIFALIFFVGIIGNAVLIFTTVANVSMRNAPNIFIASLAIGDFILILVSVPFTAVYYVSNDKWTLGTAACKANEFLQTLSLAVSIFTLTALSGDRFMAIVYPMTAIKVATTGRTITIAVTIWIFSIALALPDLFGSKVRNCQYCYPSFPVCDLYPPEWAQWYVTFRPVFRFVVFFFVPIIVITVFYVAIARVLLQQSSTPLPDEGLFGGRKAAARQYQSRKRVAKMVLSFVVIFIVCWLPRHVYILAFRFANPEYDMGWHVFKAAGFCLCFIYSCVNPIALYWISNEFRRYFDHYLCGLCFKSRRMKLRDRHDTNCSDFYTRRGTTGGAHSSASATPNMSLENICADQSNRNTHRTSV